MPRLPPPKEHQFKPGHPGGGHTGHKGKHISTLLNEIASKPFRYENPETRKISKMRGDKALAIAAFWQAIQGHSGYLKEIWERMYGKVPDEFKGELLINQLGDVFIDGKKLEVKIGDPQNSESA